MIKKFFFLLILFFLSLNFLPAKPRPTPLPTYPKQREAVLIQKQKMEKHKITHPIIWTLNWHSGVQYINWRDSPDSDEISFNMSELVFFSNQYKGSFFSVDISNLFSIYSNLSFGFVKEDFPRDVSTKTLTSQFENLSSFESELYIAKDIPLNFNVSIAPYTGYTFSKYKLRPTDLRIPLSDRIYHSMVLGGKIFFKPHRLFLIETRLSFSPLTYIDNHLLSLFQINFESSFTFTTNYFTLALIVSSRNNIEYSNISSSTNNLIVSKTGFRFRFTL